MNGMKNGVPSLALLDVTVNPLLDENLLQRGKMPSLLQFAKANFKLLSKQHPSAVGTPLQNVFDPQENGPVVFNDASIWGNPDLTIRKGK